MCIGKNTTYVRISNQMCVFESLMRIIGFVITKKKNQYLVKSHFFLQMLKPHISPKALAISRLVSFFFSCSLNWEQTNNFPIN